MIEKLRAIEERFDELTAMLADPDCLADRGKWQKLAVEHSEYEPIMQLYGQYKKLLADIDGCEEIISADEDEELVELAKADVAALKERQTQLEGEIKKNAAPRRSRRQ